jgi:hypothetical protein
MTTCPGLAFGGYRRFGETLSLPLWPGMTNEETDEVIAAVAQSALIAPKEA